MGKTIVEKIFSNKTGKSVNAGEIVVPEIDLAMIHDVNAPFVIDCFNELEVNKIFDDDKVKLFLDHLAPCPSTKSANNNKHIREFANSYNIEVFEPGEGICHQLVMEHGFAKPGQIATGTDSHTCSYGALNTMGVGVGASEMAIILASGECWFKVPETVQIQLIGSLPENVTSKDVILDIIGRITEQGAIYKCIEFGGEGLEEFSIDSRIVLTNMAVEMGAKTAIMPGDKILEKWFKENIGTNIEPVNPDSDAKYENKITINLSELQPKVAIPHSIDNVFNVSDLNLHIKIDQVFIGSCTNGRIEDLEQAARVLEGKKSHPNVRLIINPASHEIMKEATEKGLIKVFLDAGAVINPPGCGPCAGLLGGLIGDGERVVSTSNRNIKGRMGSSKSEIYIVSPIVAAYSALSGKLDISE